MHPLRRHCLVVVLACALTASAIARPETPRSVQVPAGDLVDALELLAGQYAVDVIYPSAQLKGQTTRGVNGTLRAREAFEALLEGTPLTVKEQDGAWLITRGSADTAGTVAGDSAQPMDEVAIEARRGSLNALRAEIGRLEERFYVEYNQVNADPQFHVSCRMELPTGSHVMVHFCQPVFAIEATEEQARSFAGIYNARPAELVIRQKTPAYQKHMKDIVRTHPQLLALLKERAALVRRYESASGSRISQGIAPF